MVGYRLLTEKKLKLICIWGEPSVEEYEMMQKEMLADSDYVESYSTITDVTKITVHFSTEEMNEFSRVKMPPTKIAIIASEDIAFGMSRMFGILKDIDDISPEINVFKNATSALAWLGMREFDVEKIFKEIRDE